MTTQRTADSPDSYARASTPPHVGVHHARRLALVGAVLLHPVGLTTQYLLGTPGLPRDEPAQYLGGIAEAPERAVFAAVAYVISMIGLIALAVLTAQACARLAPVSSALAGGLLAVGAIGGGAFLGLRLVAVALTTDGAIATGGAESWARLQDGNLFLIVTLFLLPAIAGTLVSLVAFVRARRDVSLWVAPAVLVALVLGSGEFPIWVTAIGGLVHAAAIVRLGQTLLRRAA